MGDSKSVFDEHCAEFFSHHYYSFLAKGYPEKDAKKLARTSARNEARSYYRKFTSRECSLDSIPIDVLENLFSDHASNEIDFEPEEMASFQNLVERILKELNPKQAKLFGFLLRNSGTEFLCTESQKAIFKGVCGDSYPRTKYEMAELLGYRVNVSKYRASSRWASGFTYFQRDFRARISKICFA